MKKVTRLVLGLMALSSICFSTLAASADSTGVSVYTDDTIAGYSTLLRTSPVIPGGSVLFKVVKPDGTNFETAVTSGHDGTASYTLPEFHTRISGEYEVYAKIPNSDYGESTSFSVLASDVSGAASTVSPDEQVVGSGKDVGEVSITLTDLYGNSIQGHIVELISSRGEDEVVAKNRLSDADGEVSFSVTSDEAGVSTYTAYDLTANKTLSKRVKVVYFDSNDYLFGDTGMAVTARAVGSSSGDVAYLGFEDVPESAETGQSLSFTLEAYDASGEVVTGYLGTAGFSVVEGPASSASLPSDYEFVAEDLGSHTFALSAVFTEAGSYVIKAEDLSESAIYGTFDLEVTASNTSISDAIDLSNPVPGSYSNNTHIISGDTAAGTSLVIYDNGTELGSAIASAQGEFVFTTTPLVDGEHEFYVSIVDEFGTVTASSESVVVNIDTTAPEVTNVDFDPSSSVTPKSDVIVMVYSEANLAQASLQVNGASYVLVDSGSGYYSAALVAPDTAGEYPFTIKLVDQLGNEGINTDGYKLNVGATTGDASGQVGAVSNLVATPGDHKITLSWAAPVSGEAVKFYRLYYGVSMDQLNYAIDTWNAETKWFIPNLKNDKEYFFAVVAIDNNGNTSAVMSNISSAIPGTVSLGAVASVDVAAGTAGVADIETMKSDVSDTGPEVLWLIIAAILGGFGYSYFASTPATERDEI
ncbi:hypothetical protein HOE67_00035 [Candidatus Peregrinibacteria bacterium]|jgi:hypothetical protein|nr:hypothetical protein [Candidatus Peregrinibacteria bacterium]MBT4055482.1 hypothetical protein [Candidatus Peregrinibacteria bacterium]